MAKIKYNGYSSRNIQKFNTQSHDIELAIADLTNEIMTARGERVFRPLFGSIIHELIFEGHTVNIDNVIKKDIKRIVNNDPRTRLDNITMNSTDHSVDIIAFITYLPDSTSVEIPLSFSRK